MSPTTLLAFASFLVLFPACASKAPPDEHRGDLDRLTFGYDGRGCFDGCSPTQAIAKGAHVVVLAKGDDPAADFHPRVAGGSLVVEKEDLACTCRETSANGSSEGSLAPGEKCYAPEVKYCSRTVSLRADAAGSAVLEMLGASGTVVDRITLNVAEPARLVASFSTYRPTGGTVRPLAQVADGAFETDAPATIDLGTKVQDEGGSELRASESDIAISSEDTPITPMDFQGELGTKQSTAGTHHITASGLGLSASFVIRVTPELPSN